MTPPPDASGRSARPGSNGLAITVLGLFFLSGASALVYEVVWTRSLTTVFGGSSFAIATVLAAFMAGLALGSTVLGRLIDRKGHPLFVYGLLEAGIALWAVLLPTLLGLMDHVYAGIYQAANPDPTALSLIRFVLSFLLLLIPTTLMGGTLPVLGKLLLTNWKGLGTRAGLLYGTNTLGAVLGVAAGGFVLLPALGLRGATLVAVFFNALVAVAAILASRRFPFHGAGPRAEEEREGDTQAQDVDRRRMRRAVLLVYGASGFAALAYEVAWTKTLSMILGTTTYAFTAMLTTFLLGLSLGSFLFGKLADRYGRPEALLALVQAAIPFASLLTIPILVRLPQIFVDNYATLAPSWIRVELYKILLAGAAMFLPTLLMGGMFPLVTRVFAERGRMGKSLGTLYAANTIGAILGSFLAGFVLVPYLGRQNAILAATFVNVAAVAVLLAALRWRGIPTFIRWGTVSVLALSALILAVPGSWNPLKRWDPRIMAAGAYVYADIISKNKTIQEGMNIFDLMFYDEATEGTVSVWRGEYTLALRTCGKVEASSHGDMITQKLLSHVPSVYNTSEKTEALLIGLASGTSAGSLLSHDIQSLDVVELIPSMTHVARIFSHYNHNVLDDPRLNIIFNDGRNQLLLSDKKYDLIASEPSNPWIAGVSALFTREFFDLTKKRLKPGGVVCIWVQLYQYWEEDLKTMMATLYEAYPYIHLWEGATGDIIIVGSLEPLRLRQDRLEEAMQGRSREDLSQLEILPMAQFASYFVTDRDGIGKLVSDWPGRVTDDNLYLEFMVPRHMADHSQGTSILFFDTVRKNPIEIFDGPLSQDPAFVEELKDYRRARLLTQLVTYNSLPSGIPNRARALEIAYETAPLEVNTRTMLGHDVNEKALQAYLSGQIQESVPHFRRAIEVGSAAERAIAYNNLGTIAFSAGGIDSARSYWEQAVRLEPGFSKVTFNLSLIAAREGNIPLACDYLREAIRVNPFATDAFNNLAYHLANTGGDLVEAEGAARRAIELNPTIDHRDTLGFVLLKQQRFQDAEKFLATIVEEDSTAYEALLHLGQARSGRGNTPDARAAFETVMQKAPRENLREEARVELEKLDAATE